MIQPQIRQRGVSRPVMKPVSTPYTKMRSYAPKGRPYRPFSKWAGVLKYASFVAKRPVVAAATAETKNSNSNLLINKTNKEYNNGVYGKTKEVTPYRGPRIYRPVAFIPLKKRINKSKNDKITKTRNAITRGLWYFRRKNTRKTSKALPKTKKSFIYSKAKNKIYFKKKNRKSKRGLSKI